MAIEVSSQAPPKADTDFTPSAVDVRLHLGKILDSPQFVNSANLRNFLKFIVDKTLAGEADEIKGYTEIGRAHV